MPLGQVSRGQPGSLHFPVKTWLREDSSNDDSGSNSGFSKSGKSSSDNSTDDSGGSQHKSGSSNGGGPGSSSSSSSQSQPSSTGSSHLPPPCILHCVPDNDPRVLYSPAWSVRSQPFFQTSHVTDVAGSSLSFTFNGSEITVYGSIPSSNTTHTPPTAAYTIDAAEPFVTAQPMATEPILYQPLFSASKLSRDMHTLLINVTNVQTESPFSIDYFIVTPSPPDLRASASAISLEPSLAVSSSSSKTPSGDTVGIIAGVLGSVIFIFLCLGVFFFVILRRRRQRAHRSKSFQSSLFTRSESILMWNDWGGRAPSAYSSRSGPFRSKA